MTQSVKYQEFEAPEQLRRYVRCAWHLELKAGSGHIETVYPDGCCELIAHRKTPMHALSAETGWRRQARCVFAAQQRSAVQLTARSDVDCIGVRLQPAASARASSVIPSSRLRARISGPTWCIVVSGARNSSDTIQTPCIVLYSVININVKFTE